MISRRRFLAAGTGLAVSTQFAGCNDSDYEMLAAQVWRAPQPAGDRAEVLRNLVRLATLAPSSHNSQCWRFRAQNDGIVIEPDLMRRCPVADPDDHHLWMSLGCAAETLSLAAPHYGLVAEQEGGDGLSEAVQLRLSPGAGGASPLLAAVARRQTCRSDYLTRPPDAGQVAALVASVAQLSGVRAEIVLDRRAIARYAELAALAVARQFAQSAFRAELLQWLRFNAGEAVARRDGLYVAANGQPSLPGWLGRSLFDWLVGAQHEAARVRAQVLASGGLLLIATDWDDRQHWVRAGRAWQRFALQATLLELRCAPVNAPLEVAELRPQVSRELGLTRGRVDMLARFGVGPALPRALRRPLAAVLPG